MDHLLYLIFRCDFDVMENLEFFVGSKHTPNRSSHVQILVQYESKRPNLGQSSQNPSEVRGTAAAASIGSIWLVTCTSSSQAPVIQVPHVWLPV